MKNITSLIVALFAILSFGITNAQERSKFMEEKNSELNSTQTFLGFSTGLNNSAGIIGFNAEQKLKNQLTAHGAIGIGTWGTKYTLGLRKYKRYPIGGTFSASFSFATGTDEIETEMRVKNLATSVVVDTIVMMRLNPAAALNLSWAYHLKISKRSKMYFEAGYSLPLSPNRQYRILTNGYGATDVSDFTMRILQPSGIILAIGFLFGS
jgi:hypothetical protein